MGTVYTSDGIPNRPEEIFADIIGRLEVTDQSEIDAIRETFRQTKKDHDRVLYSPNPSRRKSRNDLKKVLKTLEEMGGAAWYGTATDNRHNVNREALEHDKRFHHHRNGLMEEIRYKLEYWPLQLGKASTRDVARGTPKKNYRRPGRDTGGEAPAG